MFARKWLLGAVVILLISSVSSQWGTYREKRLISARWPFLLQQQQQLISSNRICALLLVLRGALRGAQVFFGAGLYFTTLTFSRTRSICIL